MKIKVDKHVIFTDYVWSFMMPDHEHWKKEIENIITVEKNKSIHNFSTENLQDRPVRAHKTAWDSFARYPAVFNILKIISSTIQQSIEQDGWEAPTLNPVDGWINWFEKNQFIKGASQDYLMNMITIVYFPLFIMFHQNTLQVNFSFIEMTDFDYVKKMKRLI